MIIDSDKSFGYPVLRPLYEGQNPAELDYVNLPFEPVLLMAKDRFSPDSHIFTWEYECAVEDIDALLEAGAIKPILHLYNRNTWLSDSFDLSGQGKEGELSIKSSMLSGNVELRLLFSTSEKVSIRAPQIHPDYGYDEFTVPKNSIVAFSDSTPYNEKPYETRSITSFFQFFIRSELDDGEFFYSLDQDEVHIFANEDQILKFREFEVTEKLQSVILSGLYAPVVTEMVKLVYEKQDDDTDPCNELEWFKKVQQAMESLPPDKSQKHRPEITAHNIFKRPLNKLTVDR